MITSRKVTNNKPRKLVDKTASNNTFTSCQTNSSLVSSHYHNHDSLSFIGECTCNRCCGCDCVQRPNVPIVEGHLADDRWPIFNRKKSFACQTDERFFRFIENANFNNNNNNNTINMNDLNNTRKVFDKKSIERQRNYLFDVCLLIVEINLYLILLTVNVFMSILSKIKSLVVLPFRMCLFGWSQIFKFDELRTTTPAVDRNRWTFSCSNLVECGVRLLLICAVFMAIVGVLIKQLSVYLKKISIYDLLILKLVDSKGVKCNDEMDLYFILTEQNHQRKLIQIEASYENTQFRIRYCSYGLAQLDDNTAISRSEIQPIIIQLDFFHLDDICSNLNQLDQSYTSFSQHVSLTNMISPPKSESYCFQSFESCTPIIERQSRKLNVNNQLDVDIKHCSCFSQYFDCMNKYRYFRAPSWLETQLAAFKSIHEKCFHYEFKQRCQLFILGVCLRFGNHKCHVKLVHI